jgi:cell division septal protein FtsQ
MKRRKKGLQVYRASNHTWFGDQLLKVISIGFAIIMTCGIVSLLAYQGLSRSLFFQIEAVDIQGCHRTTPTQILGWSGLDVKTNLWTVRISRLRKKLENQHWIAAATIVRNWPNKLAITVRERAPLALVSTKSGLFYVDRGGVVFAEVMPVDDRDFPVITGVEPENIPGVHEEQRLRDALDFIIYSEKGTASLPKQNISEIHVNEDGGLVLFMADHAFPVMLGKGKMKTNYHRISTILSWLYRKEKIQLAASVDMNYLPEAETAESPRQRVLVRMSEYKAAH